MPTIAFALWLTLLGRSTGHTILHVELVVDRGTASQRMIDTAVGEAAAIWAPYGIDVYPAGSRGPSSGPASRLYVVVSGHRIADAQNGSIGTIAFSSGTPRPYVSLFAGDIHALVEETVGARACTWPSVQRDEVEGRALGRALAHEIGHYVLRTREHARSGLMRAIHPVPVLIDSDRRRFTLSAGEIVRLAALHGADADRVDALTARVTTDRNSSQSNPPSPRPKAGGTMSYD